jgi:hypothetical protein
MRALCVARHPILSEHLCRFFDELGVDTVPCVGAGDTLEAASVRDVDLIICDYDLLATMPIAMWETDAIVRELPVIAVSLTRHPDDVHLLDVNGIAGFLYLPTLDPEAAQRLLAAVRRTRGGINPPDVLPWPAPTPIAQQLR